MHPSGQWVAQMGKMNDNNGPIRRWRLERGITQMQLSSSLGMSQRTLSAYECGTMPPRERLLVFAELGISIEEMVRWAAPEITVKIPPELVQTCTQEN